MGAIAIIPARGGSKRIPGKNIKFFHGKPIIHYSIEIALSISFFDEVYVSTDSQEIAGVALEYKNVKIISREEKYAQNEVGTQEVISRDIEKIGYKGLVCCIYPCAPLINREDIIFALGFAMAEYENTSYIFSVGESPLHDAGQWYIGTSKAFERREPLISLFSRMYPIQPERDCDINTYDDWARAERMYADLNGG